LAASPWYDPLARVPKVAWPFPPAGGHRAVFDWHDCPGSPRKSRLQLEDLETSPSLLIVCYCRRDTARRLTVRGRPGLHPQILSSSRIFTKKTPTTIAELAA